MVSWTAVWRGDRQASDAVRIVLDDTAMTTAGQGNVLASRLIHRTHAEPNWFLYAPACALVESDRARQGTAGAPRVEEHRRRPEAEYVSAPSYRPCRHVPRCDGELSPGTVPGTGRRAS